ncbi:hypothetical protein M0804_001136 [Polistes exclamans]|nr:hypothetical protein M0804_001136 [Polistes exclamans]
MSLYLNSFYLWQLVVICGVPFSIWLAAIIIDIFKERRTIKLEDKDNDILTKETERQIPLKRRHLPLFKKNNSWVINHIQEETKTKIMFVMDTLRRPDRQLLIRGPLQGVIEADKMVRKAVKDKCDVDVYDMGIRIESVEKFIGREKDILRDIQGTSGANLMIRSEVDPLSGPMARILITGTCKQISKAIPLVEEKLKNYTETKVTSLFAKREPTLPIPDLKLLDLLVIGQEMHIHVEVRTIKNPSHFYIQVSSLQEIESEQLQTEMNEFYNNTVNQKTLVMYNLKKGHIVAVKREDENWYRAEILEVHDDHCLLMFVDIGVQDTAKKFDMYEMPQYFVRFVVQAYECMLSNVGEPEGGWTDEAIARFKELCDVKSTEKLCMHVKNTKIVIRAKASTRKHVYVVDLFKEDLNIGVTLRKEKHAILVNTMTSYYKSVPTEDEVKLKELLSSFKTYKEMDEDIDEELETEQEFIDLDLDEEFDSGDHDNINNLVHLLKTTPNISEDKILNNVPIIRKRAKIFMNDDNSNASSE